VLLAHLILICLALIAARRPTTQLSSMLKSGHSSDRASYSTVAASEVQAAPDGNEGRSSQGVSREGSEHCDLETPSHPASPKRSRTPFSSPWIWLYGICVPLGFFGGIIIMLAIGGPRITQDHASTVYTREPFPKATCDHSGNFGVGLNAPSFWSPSQTFKITLSFGSFTFSTAKFIDVVWDVVLAFHHPFCA
jgi:hypothetical protein